MATSCHEPRRTRRRTTTCAPSSSDAIISPTLTALIALAVACSAVHATPTHPAALPSHLAALPVPTRASPRAEPEPQRVAGGLHVPLLRRNGHLRALARTPNPVDQSEIVAGWALREKGRVAVKYGIGADNEGDAGNEGGVVLAKRAGGEAAGRGDSAGQSSDVIVAGEEAGQVATGPRRKPRRRRTPLTDGDTLASLAGGEDDADAGDDDDDIVDLVRRQLGGPNGGQLGTATSATTTTTRTALSTAGYGTATLSSNNSATRTAPTSLPGPTTTLPVGDVQLTNYDADLSYYAPIGIGVPAQYMNCILDTGSADLWIASTNCTSSTGCSSTVPLYNSSLSRTAIDMNTSFSVRYGSGQATGEMMQDYVAFAGYNVSSQAFALVQSVSQDLLGGDISGLMGLGWQPLAASQAVPWWQNLYQGNALPFPGFAVSLSRFVNVPNASSVEPGGSLTFGYLNSSLYASEINYVALPSGQESYWLIRMDQVAVNGTNVTSWAQGQGQMAAIDTGTTLIGGPRDVIANIYAQVPGARAATGAYTGYYSYPCSANVSVALTFGGVNYNMSTADFNLGPFGIDSRTNQSTCLGAFFDLAFSSSSRINWVIGAAFLKNVYSVYRANPPAVGFATLSNSSHPMPYFPSNSSDPAHDGNLTAIPGGIYGPSGAPGGANGGANAGVRTTLVAANTVTTAVQIGGAVRSLADASTWMRLGVSVVAATVLGFGVGLLR